MDLRPKVTAGTGDFTRINPKVYVSTLQLDTGDVLTEGPAIMQYLVDQKPGSPLAAPPDAPCRPLFARKD